MPSFPNQNTVDTVKEVCDRNHPYSINNLNTLQEAMMVLQGSEFKLWMYFAKNQDGYRLECSPVEIAKWGITPRTYYRAFEKLKKLGFLEQKSEHYYVFHEKPIKVTNEIVEIQKEEFNF